MSADIDALTAKANGFTKLGSAFNLIGDAMIGAGVAAAAGLGMAVDYAVKYQDAINRITAVTPDLAKHNSELAQLNQQIQSSAVQYAQDPTQIAQGAYYLFSSLGVLGKQPSDLLNNNIINDIAAYSRASGPVGQGGVSFSDAAQILPRIFAASNTPMSEWGGDLGTMTFLENQAHMTQEQLANAGLAFLPTSSLLGINTPDSMTLMAAIASAGRTGAPAGRETMSALTLMLSGKNQQAELNKLGYQNNDFFDPKTGNMLPPDVVMTMLAAKLLPMQPGDRLAAEHQLFGQVGLRAMGPLLQGMDKYNNLISDEKKAGVYHNPEGAQKYMQDLAAKMMNSPKSQLEQLLSSLKVLGIQIGTAVLPPLIQFAHWLTQAVAALTSFVQAHPQLAKTVALAAAPALIGGGLGMKGLGGVFSWLGSPYKEGVHVPTIADHLGGKLFGVAPAMGPLQSGFGGREGGLSGFARSAWGVGQAAPGALLHGAIAAPGAIWGGITSGATAVMDVLDNVALHLMHPLTTAQQLGGALKSLAIGGFGLLKSAILGLPELLGGIVAVGFPIIAVALLIAGAVAIGVLAFTRFRTQTEHLLTVFKDALTPALKLVEAGIYTLVERARAIWEKMAPQIDAAMAKLYPSLERLGPLLQTIGIIIGGVITTVLAIISGLVNGFLTALPPIIGFFSQIANLFADVFAFISDLIHGNWLAAWHDFFHIFADAFSAVGDLLKGVWDFISGFVQGVIGFFQNLADVLVGHSIIPDMITAIVQWFQSLPSQIFSILIGFFNWIQGSFVNLANAALQWGQNFISMLGQGIQSAVGDVLSPVTNLANDISNFLGFNSPPKAGPLSTSDHWMPNMMTMLGTGVTSNTTSVLGPINGLTQGISSSFATMNTNVTASVASTNAAIASLGSGSGSGGGAGNGAGSGAGGGSGSGSGDGVPTGTPTKDITDANAKMQKIIADTNAAMAQQQAQAQGQDLGGPTAADQNKQAWINYLNQQYAKVGLNTIYNQSPDTGPQGATTSAMDQYKQYVSAMGMAQTAFNNGYIVNEKAAMDSWLMVQSTGLTTAERQQNASQEAKIRSNIQYLKSVQDKTGMSQADKIKANQDALNVLLAQDATADKTRLQNYQNYLETLETFTVTDYQKQTMQDDAHNTANEGRQRSALHSQYLTQQAAAAQAQQAKITDYQKQQTIDKTDFTTVEGMTKQHFLNLQTTINAAQAPAAQAGLNVVTGFVNGILNNLFKVDDAGQQLAGRIQGAVTNHLGIHSPSAVFHEFGHMSVEGYRQGVLTHSPSLERLWGAFGPLGSARNGGALHFDSMHVGALHAEGLNQGAQPAPAERPTAWTMGYTRQIQAQRESINARYETHLQDFDFDYRRATQYSS
jgi:TP901 family phage tail tape measure protein